MLELGPDEDAYHLAAGEQANRAGLDVLITIGPLAKKILQTFSGATTFSTDDASNAATLLEEVLEPGDLALIKGSRGLKLETIAEQLQRSGDGKSDLAAAAGSRSLR
jgi:UDP-N-acetylmuramoyl-tripeptide--D-alanyl-D-alanine ligase